jgi:hypothetical protein
MGDRYYGFFYKSKRNGNDNERYIEGLAYKISGYNERKIIPFDLGLFYWPYKKEDVLSISIPKNRGSELENLINKKEYEKIKSLAKRIYMQSLPI